MIIIIVIAIALNFSFFRPDIWSNVNDSDLQTGARWDEARWASIGDYWPQFGHKIPNIISDGKYINYFPGWDKEPNSDGLILANGAVFRNTLIRSWGNIISLVAIIIWFIGFVKFKNE